MTDLAPTAARELIVGRFAWYPISASEACATFARRRPSPEPAYRAVEWVNLYAEGLNDLHREIRTMVLVDASTSTAAYYSARRITWAGVVDAWGIPRAERRWSRPDPDQVLSDIIEMARDGPGDREAVVGDLGVAAVSARLLAAMKRREING